MGVGRYSVVGPLLRGYDNFNPWHICEGYHSCFVCVCVCTCVSVTKVHVAATYLKQGAVRLYMAVSRYPLCGFRKTCMLVDKLLMDKSPR